MQGLLRVAIICLGVQNGSLSASYEERVLDCCCCMAHSYTTAALWKMSQVAGHNLGSLPSSKAWHVLHSANEPTFHQIEEQPLLG